MPEENSRELDNCKKLADEYLNGWKRAKADFINYQKEETKRLGEVVQFANEALIRDVIVVLDSFNLALASLEHEGAAQKGVSLIQTQLEDMLKKHGLERLKVSAGQKFDPALHEAVGEVESSQETETIVEEVGHGYLLHGKVVRPARVKIAICQKS